MSPDLLGEPERNVQLAGCALNTVTELQTTKALKGHVLKQILSQEPIAGRRLYQNLFTFTPRCMNIWACNELPQLNDQHPSLMRRFLMMRMGETLTDTEAAADFEGVVQAEAEGIIALLVESFLTVMARGRFLLPADSDILVCRMQFGDEIAPIFARIRLEAKPGSRLTTEELRRELRSFAVELDLDPDEAVHDGTMKQLAGLMKTSFRAVRRKINGRPFYEGVTLRGPRTSPDGPPAPDHADGDLGGL